MSSMDRGAMSEGSDRIQGAGERRGVAELLLAGQPGAGEFRCSRCGYGVIVQLELPRCPMCSGTAWEQLGWAPRRRDEPLQ
jgi:rubrerythrin